MIRVHFVAVCAKYIMLIHGSTQHQHLEMIVDAHRFEDADAYYII